MLERGARCLTVGRVEGLFGVLAVWGALLVLFFVPKFNVAAPAEGTYIGPKPDDVWIGTWLVLGMSGILRGGLRLWRSRAGMVALGTMAVLYALSLIHVVNGSGRIEFAGRSWMYWLWGVYCAGLLMGALSTARLLKVAGLVALVWGVVLMELQAGGALAVPALGCWNWSVPGERTSGVFSHPTELGAVTCFVLAIVVTGSGHPLVKLVAVAAAFWANTEARNRAGLLGVILVVTFWLWHRASVRAPRQLPLRSFWGRIAKGLGAAALLAAGVVLSAELREGGSAALTAALQQCSMAADWAASSAAGVEVAGVELAKGDAYDRSLLVRCVNWSSVLSRLAHGGMAGWMFGLGPGAVGEAADGLVVRVLGEFGLVGLLAYALHWLAVYSIARRRLSAPEGVSVGLLALFAQALVLDVLYFSRVAYLVYTCMGLKVAQATGARE